MTDLFEATKLLILGMGGIFTVMALLYLISQLILKITAPKK